jgi:acetyl-CoA acyltransferase 2
MSGLFIVGARRTAFGAFGGRLKELTATQLGVAAATHALADARVDPARVGTCVFGNVAQTAADAAYLSRHVALKAGLPLESTALTVNRLCGSGFQSLISAAHELREAGGAGEGLALVGGAESMSQAPLSLWGHTARFGHRLGVNPQLTDTLWAGLTDSHCGLPMGVTAEKLAARYRVTRADSDEFALRSQRLWAAAAASGPFDSQIAPIEVRAGGRAGGRA